MGIDLTRIEFVGVGRDNRTMGGSILLVLAYLLLVGVLRFRRCRSMLKQYGYRSRQDLARMTFRRANEIILSLAELEFPTMYQKGLEFALLRSKLESK